MRKIIQIATTTSSDGSGSLYNFTIAACDDGTIWGMCDPMVEKPCWFQLPPIPQDEVSEVFDKLPEDIMDVKKALEQGGICERCGATSQQQQFFNDYLCMDCKRELDLR